mmetsp:Transcript_7773/g.14654  ORF Transcript_7773/g.14654 Transcript_7773/m.14654 type:complete len:541 (-) Transcript_7773:1681-3303(-)
MNSDDQEQSTDFVDVDRISHLEHKENGNSSYKQQDYRTAISHYTLAIETAKDLRQSPSSASLQQPPPCDSSILATYYNNRAAAFTMILQYEEVIEDCNQAILHNPSFLKAYFRKAKAQISLGLLSLASDTLNKAAIYDPNNSTIVSLKQEVETLIEKIDSVRSLLEKTDDTREFPPFPLPKVRDAQQALNQILLISASCPAWRDILVEKTKAFVALGKLNDVYATTSSLMRTKDGNNYHNSSRLLLYRAYALQHMGNLDDAMKHLKQILSIDPDNRFAFAFHKILRTLGKKKEEADANYKNKDYEKAAESYSEALDMKGCIAHYRAKVYFNRACASANLRNHKQVIFDCTKALELDSEYIKAILRRAGSYLVIGGEAGCSKAIQDYETIMDFAEKSGDEVQKGEMKKKLREAKAQLKRSKQKDFYKILNVPRDATDSEIKKSYRKCALKWHPDRHANSSEEEKTEAEKVFRDVNHAYEVLSDPQKKAKYDSGVDIEDLDNPHAGHGGMGGHGHHFDSDILFEMFMRQQTAGMHGGGFHFG